ncbi:unnamed protein product, partial [Oppiella nova]
MSHQTEVEVLSAHTSELTTVPCVQLSVNNVTHWWPHVLQSINASHFVAIDLELSGLGARDRLNAKKIDERYEGVMSAAKSRSIVSVGLAFFSFSANDCNQTIVNNICDTKYGTSCETNVNSAPSLSNCISDCVEDMNRFERLLDTQLMDKLDDQTNGCNGSDLNSGDNEWKINAEVFNALCLCDEEYVCEPETMRFLAGHGFDFNGQCLHGL